MVKEKRNDEIICDIGAERAVLAGVCKFGKDGFYEVNDLISTNTFTVQINQYLYTCLEKVFEKFSHIDLATLMSVANELHLERIISETKSLEYIRSLFNFPIKLENIRLHAKKIAKLEFARKSQTAHIEAYQELSQINGNESIDEIMDISQSHIFQLVNELNNRSENNPEKFGDSVDDYVEMVQDEKRVNIGIPTPFPIFNEVIGKGMRNGGVTLIVARAKTGKSSIAINIGIHVSRLTIPVLYLDTEMDLVSNQSRILANLSGEKTVDIECGQCNIPQLKRGASELKQLPFYHKSVAGKKFNEILSIMRRWIVQNVGYNESGKTKPCLIIYDYFKIMDQSEIGDMAEFQALGYQISQLSDFTKEYDFPCLAFCQTNRDGITKDTSDIISQSDRLLWLCTSASVWKRKTPEEIVQDGKENGNMKLKPFEDGVRFGPGLFGNDYINFEFDRDRCIIKELNTKSSIEKNKDGFDSSGATSQEF